MIYTGISSVSVCEKNSLICDWKYFLFCLRILLFNQVIVLFLYMYIYEKRVGCISPICENSYI